MPENLIVKYSSSQKSLWDQFINDSVNGTFLFNRDFMEYHSHKFEDYSLLIFKGETLIAVLPSNIEDSILHSHQGLTYGSLVYKNDVKFKDLLLGFKALLEFLQSKNISTLRVKNIPYIYYKAENYVFSYILALVKADNCRSDTLSIIKPTNTKYAKDRKAGYKRGVKHNLLVKEEHDLSIFWNEILVPNLDSKHGSVPVHSLEEITLLKQNFNDSIRQFNVYHNDVLVAGTTIFETDTVARSQYISGNELKNKLGSLDFLHVHLLENVFKDKPYFDFGTSNVNSGKQINEGLLYWKLGFGASIHPHNYYEIDTKNHTLLKNVFI